MVRGQVVSVLPFYSNNPSLNSAEVYIFKFVKMSENKRKRGLLSPFERIFASQSTFYLARSPTNTAHTIKGIQTINVATVLIDCNRK